MTIQTTTILRASSRVEHFGYVGIAAVDVFQIHSLMFWLSVVLLLSGALACCRDCLLWARDEDRKGL